ncbi:MAG: hypothetical protein ACI8XO_001168 [Verrucomicrobiales bacterium]|jgi:hypothetical protein
MRLRGALFLLTPMKDLRPITALIAFSAYLMQGGLGAPSDALEKEFSTKIKPLLTTYCLGCHGGEKAKGGINIEDYETLSAVRRNPKFWKNVVHQITDGEMPPEDEKQPSAAESAVLVSWLEAHATKIDLASIPRDPGRVTIRRLNRAEYNNTMRDLFGIKFQPGKSFPADGAGGAGFDNNADTLFLPPILMEKYLDAASEVLDEVFADEGLLQRVIDVRPGDKLNEQAAARKILTSYTYYAFRRFVTQEEVGRFMTLFDKADARGDSFDDGVKLALKAVLVSPRFLFRQEKDRSGSKPYRIDDFELATRLSYFLWASMPDRALLQLASKDQLHKPEVLRSQVDRMLKDPKSEALADRFAGQWLGFNKMREEVQPDKSRFPEFDFPLRIAMYREPLEFFSAMVGENLSVLELLDSKTTFVNARLAKHYGLPPVAGTQMRRVGIPPTRGGVLGMGAILASTSLPLRTSPVLRGRYVLDELLGTPPPPPPPDAGQLPADDRQPDGLSFRKRLEIHRQRAECSGCHSRMDPIGFGLENFDPIGRYRTSNLGQPIDSSGKLPSGEKFKGATELRAILLKEREQFAYNLTEKMLGYALGRGLEYYDLPTVYSLRDKLIVDEYRIQTLIHGITASFPFQYRRNQPIE